MQIDITWETDDVLWVAENNDITLTTEQADEILMLLYNKHDANLGINWDVIYYTIENYLNK
jgi:hypothetical protein